MKYKPIILLFLAALGLFFIILSFAKHDRSRTVAVEGLDAPFFSVTNEDGKTSDTEQFQGKVVFLNFWASWCSPCIDELPSIAALYNKLRHDKGIEFVFILYRDDLAKAKSLLNRMGIAIPVSMDTHEEAADAFGVTGVPETYIIDRKGILRKKIIGPYNWYSGEATALINTIRRK